MPNEDRSLQTSRIQVEHGLDPLKDNLSGYWSKFYRPDALPVTHQQYQSTEWEKPSRTRMWANAQPDGRPAEHRWRPLFNAAKFG